MGPVTLNDESLLAIEVVVDIAVLGLAKATELALRQGLHPRYLERLLRRLARKGIIMGARGRQGGYQLARAAALIRASEVVLAATREPIHARKAQGYPAIKRLVVQLEDCTLALLQDVTIASLAY
jgi:Rrf2 family protein